MLDGMLKTLQCPAGRTSHSIVRSIENGSQLRELYKLSLLRCRNTSTENNGLGRTGSTSRSFFSILSTSVCTNRVLFSISIFAYFITTAVQHTVPICFPFSLSRFENVFVKQHEQCEEYHCFMR